MDVFEKVDLYFAKMIFPSGDEKSHLFLSYIFSSARGGHLCVILQEGKLYPPPPLDLHDQLVDGALNLPPTVGIVQCENRWYLERNYECERRFLADLERIKSFQSPIKSSFADIASLTIEQNNAIRKALYNPLTLICGGPGTGKSRTACALIAHYCETMDSKIAVAAPTGKATSNLRLFLEPFKEKCSVSTLQSLLHSKKEDYLPYDVIVVDEGSMVDAFVMQELFASVKEGAQLVILGDIHQLPPVGTGNFFRDLVEVEPQLTIYLTKCLRAELHEIVEIASKINDSIVFPIEPLLTQKELIELLVNKLSLRNELSLDELFMLYRKWRLITPQRKGVYGVDTMNHHLYKMHKELHGRFIPIIIKTNDQKLDLYNGDFGFLDLKEEKGYFEGGKSFPISFLPPFEYGYLLSIHKSQGSEYDEVVVIVPEGSDHFGKEMLYTAVTRAKKKITIYGGATTLSNILKKQTQRLSLCQNPMLAPNVNP